MLQNSGAPITRVSVFAIKTLRFLKFFTTMKLSLKTAAGVQQLLSKYLYNN